MAKTARFARREKLISRLRQEEREIRRRAYSGTLDPAEIIVWNKCLRKDAYPDSISAEDAKTIFIKMEQQGAINLRVYPCRVQRSDALGPHYHFGHPNINDFKVLEFSRQVSYK